MKLLSVVGGVPKYLEEINFGQSAESNLKRLCYQPEGYLFKEFEELFRDSFGNQAPIYKTIVEKLSTGFFGIEDIAAHMGWLKGGRISEYLNDLNKSGFIARHTTKVPGKKISITDSQITIYGFILNIYTLLKIKLNQEFTNLKTWNPFPNGKLLWDSNLKIWY